MIWSVVRLWGFQLDKHGDDLAVPSGAFTRVIASIPLRRVHTLTISESPLHRLLLQDGLSAGGLCRHGAEAAVGKAPPPNEISGAIVRRSGLPRLLGEVIPELAWSSVSLVGRGASRARFGGR